MISAVAKLPVSVVVCTDGRAASLAQTLCGLHRLDYPTFEICVVFGPNTDSGEAMLREWDGAIKTASCPERNLGQARNIGIALAAGDVVAFIDDDAIPESEWLGDLATAYADPQVGAAGGFVYDHTGVELQAKFVTADRFGNVKSDWKRPAIEFNFPLSNSFPHLIGTNCSFRRSALLSVGGFDEEYEYYLDETDLCCRIIDSGWSIAQVRGAYVHHKFLPSAMRRNTKLLVSWYPIVKNKIYHMLVNRHGHHTISDVMREANNLVEGLRHDLERAIADGELDRGIGKRFWLEVERAWEVGLAHGLEGSRRLMPPVSREAAPPAFRNATVLAPDGGRRTFCLLSHEYPPQIVGGVGRYIHQLAMSIAGLGHQVHVMTAGEGHDRVDFEGGVWVHRIVVRHQHIVGTSGDGGPLPPQIWSYSATMLDEICRVAEHRTVSGVYAPIWDCEGVAVLRDGRFPLMTGLQTMLQFWMQSNPDRSADPEFASSFIRPMLSLENEMLTASPMLHAISAAILKDAAQLYDVDLAARAAVIPLGLDDYRLLSATPAPAPRPGTCLRVLFVGRLESRKGIDVLLEAAREVLPRFTNVQIDIVGNDRLSDAAGTTPRAGFEADGRTAPIRDRVVFHGEVDEPALRGFYESCDVFVAPSRFESFGLIFVEAMMYSKPVIGCRSGGMPEVIVDGQNGLLAEPGDTPSLVACMTRLLEDPALRRKLGEAGRHRYEHFYTPDRLAYAVVATFERAATARPAAA
jgi:glycogen(starch) synthase